MTTPIRELPPGRRHCDGSITFSTYCTPDTFPVIAGCPVPSDRVIPVIFVPGIMGSNLMSTEEDTKGEVSWRAPNGAFAALKQKGQWDKKSPAQRQSQLNPNATSVDGRGDIKSPRRYAACLNVPGARERGWGEVHLNSYGEVLDLLSEKLGRVFERRNYPTAEIAFYRWWEPLLGAGQGVHKDIPADFKLTEAELRHHARFHFPVYACGYNWLQSNADSAKMLAALIKEVIAEQHAFKLKCDKVILVTHSMGGLVARACAKLQGKEGVILGIVHGVQPAIGAPAAYRRIAAGTETSSPSNGLLGDIEGNVFATIAGKTPAETSPVMANSPGALELLPNHLYPSGWLRVAVARAGSQERPHEMIQLPRSNPYKEIYRSRGKVYSLIDPAFLDPTANKSGAPGQANDAWKKYLRNIARAEEFHKNLGSYYHPNTYVYYGADKEKLSYGTVCWQGASHAYSLPNPVDLEHARTRPGYHAGSRQVNFDVPPPRMPPLPSHGQTPDTRPPQDIFMNFTLAAQDVPGDGTVPQCSGEAPKGKAGVKKCVKMTGFSHQESYKKPLALNFVLHAICKMVQEAK